MCLTGILEAKRVVLNILDSMTVADRLHQGKIDITEHIDFQDIAGQFDLTQGEYDELINDTQELVEGAVRRYLKQLKAEKKINELVERRTSAKED